MSGYCKLSSNLINSSVWDEADGIRIVWVTLLAMADAAGFVQSSLPGLAHQCRKSREETLAALAVLEAPDPDSQNPDNEGRRIARVESGWLIFNYVLYRAQAEVSDDPADVMNRARVQRHRDRKREERTALQTITPHYQTVTPASASASASAFNGEEDIKEKPQKSGRPTREMVDGFFKDDPEEANNFWDHYESNGWRVGRNAMKDWQAAARRWIRNPSDFPRHQQPQLQMSPQHRQNRINYFNEKKQKINRMIKDPNNPPSWAITELARIDQEMQNL